MRAMEFFGGLLFLMGTVVPIHVLQAEKTCLVGLLPPVVTEFDSLERELERTRSRRVHEAECMLQGRVSLLLEWRVLGWCVATCAIGNGRGHMEYENRMTDGADGLKRGTNFVLSAKLCRAVDNLIREIPYYRFYRASATRKGMVVTAYTPGPVERRTFFFPVEIGYENTRRVMEEGDEASGHAYREFRTVVECLMPVAAHLSVEMERAASEWHRRGGFISPAIEKENGKCGQ